MARLVFVPPLLPAARTRRAQRARSRAKVVGGMAGGESWAWSWGGGSGPR